ncbi:MAG: amidase [Alphaproteobacteria bacterium]|nr:amidase [Alphaproteobacteria bacterium]
MTFKQPTAAQLREVGAELGLDMSDDDYVETLRAYLAPFCEAYAFVGQLAEDLPAVKYPRTPGYRPEGDDNPYGAWYVKTTVEGAPSGPLAGGTVAVKDTVCLAGVPMMNGASVLEGYVPEVDATIVTRLLDAGATILGKSVCEYFSVAGGSHTSASGLVENPRKAGHTPGGSSTGSAALVAAGEVDMGIGGDQAGSIRIPASFSGVVGMKPTHGLVPYTGVMSIEPTIDHAGPLTADVADNARFLGVMAGPDGLDARQGGCRVERYTQVLDRDIKGLRVGVVREGFGTPDSEPDVDQLVRKAAKSLAKLGAEVEEVSVPWHTFAVPLWVPLTLEGTYFTLVLTNGLGVGSQGLYVNSLANPLSALRERANELPDTARIILMLARYSLKNHGMRFYGKAQNLRRRLRAAYDAALESHDVLVMPTTTMKATPIPPPDAPFEERMQRSWENIGNTCAFNVTGHPSLSIPCGVSDDRPVGLMITGRHWQEAMLYRVAHAFERSVDWRAAGPTKKTKRRKRT